MNLNLNWWQRTALSTVLKVKGFEFWFRTRALQLPFTKRNEVAARLQVSPLVVDAVQAELQAHALAELKGQIKGQSE
jgi:hypothetical protein